MKFIDLPEGTKFSLVSGKPETLVKLFTLPRSYEVQYITDSEGSSIAHRVIQDKNTVDLVNKTFITVDPQTNVYSNFVEVRPTDKVSDVLSDIVAIKDMNLLSKELTDHEYASNGWTVRVISQGTDKSDYHVVRVQEEPGYEGKKVTYRKNQRTFDRQHPVLKYRREARNLRKKLIAEKGNVSNMNSWRSQSGDYENYN